MIEERIIIEIELPVTFDYTPAVPATWDDPGEPAFIENIDFSDKEVILLVDKELRKEGIKQTLMELAEERI